jgi:DNA-binding MarR family transcriptional regulator
MLKINLYKILFILQKRENYLITTGELADLTKINCKNIGRYLNILEDHDLISRKIYQEKKKRYILNSLTRKGENFLIPHFYLQILKKFYES